MTRATIIAFVVLILTVSSASSSQIVREFKGSGATTTSAFRVESPWIIDWRLDGDFDALVALDVTLIEAKTGRHIGRVLHTKNKGNGVKLFREAGEYQLRVSSTLGRWRLRIEQLTAEEAELYLPKRPPASVFQ